MMTYRCEQGVPKFLLQDKNGYALAKAIEKAMNRMFAMAKQGFGCLSDIEVMPEWRLDERAAELGCYYDSTASEDTKREMIRAGEETIKSVGTPRAMELAINSLYPGTKVQEAAEYGGEPFHFRVLASLNERSAESGLDSRCREAISFFQNARSVCDGLIYFTDRTFEKSVFTGITLRVGVRQTIPCGTAPGEEEST